MRTTLNIDSKLLEYVIEATGEKSKSKAVSAALKEYVRRKHVQELIDSWGKIIVEDYSEEHDRLDRERQSRLESLGDDTA
jgi:metal-responsive CopG/Arc/MetJ family transcriptional regulator